MNTSEDWVEDAACAKFPPSLTDAWFFPTRYFPGTVAAAKTVCSGCPVLNECRAWNDACEADVQGVWGVCAGETPEERIKRRGLKREPRPELYSKSGNCVGCGAYCVSRTLFYALDDDAKARTRPWLNASERLCEKCWRGRKNQLKHTRKEDNERTEAA